MWRSRASPTCSRTKPTKRCTYPQQQPVVDDYGGGFIGDYFGLALSGTQTLVLNVSTADLGSNPDHYQQQVLQTLSNP